MTTIGVWASWIGDPDEGSGATSNVAAAEGGAPGAAGGGAEGGGIGGEGGGAGAGGGGGGGRAGGAGDSEGRDDRGGRGQYGARHQRGGGPGLGRGGDGGGVSDTRRSQMMTAVMDQLRKEGVPEANLRAAAAHLTGQAVMESGITPGASHDVGTGFGIYGARLERRAKMLSWMKEHGYQRESLEGQARYMAHEAMSGRYPKTRNILMHADPKSFSRDVPIVTKEFEAPKIVNRRTGAVENAFRNEGTIADRELAPGTVSGRGRGGGGDEGGAGRGGSTSPRTGRSSEPSTVAEHGQPPISTQAGVTFTPTYRSASGAVHGYLDVAGHRYESVTGGARGGVNVPRGSYRIGGSEYHAKLHGSSYHLTGQQYRGGGGGLFFHRGSVGAHGASQGCFHVAPEQFASFERDLSHLHGGARMLHYRSQGEKR